MKTVRENVMEYYHDEPLTDYQLMLLILLFSRVLQ
jgi:hypothetical protein